MINCSIKKSFSKILAIIMGCSMIMNGSACAKTPKTTHNLTITEFNSPVSLVAYPVEAYLNADPEVLVTDFLLKETTRFDKGEPVVFSYDLESDVPADVEAVVLEFSFQKDFSVIEKIDAFTADEQLAVYNLQTGRHYYFRLSVQLSDGQTVSKTGEFETASGVRMISLDGASNVRDIGGWKTESGKIVKQGLLYRGGEIDGGRNTGHPDFCLTKKGIAQLRSFGIKTDFDLRSEENKVSQHSILGSDVKREFYNAAQYQYVLEPTNAETTRKIFSDLAKKEAYPIYLHCSHGVDRAGTTVFLLEALLGVAKEDLIRDYELSAFYHNYQQVNRHIENGGNILKLMDGLETYEGETFSEKVISFMLSIGVTADELNSIRSIFLG